LPCWWEWAQILLIILIISTESSSYIFGSKSVARLVSQELQLVARILVYYVVQKWSKHNMELKARTPRESTSHRLMQFLWCWLELKVIIPTNSFAEANASWLLNYSYFHSHCRAFWSTITL
jgi:hypothetical protein